MLDERTLSGMDQDQLLRYVAILHGALGHLLGAAGEAQAYVERNAPDAAQIAVTKSHGSACRSSRRWPLNLMPRVCTDPPSGRPKRPCSSCGRMFLPTVTRRMLCRTCFQQDGAHRLASTSEWHTLKKKRERPAIEITML